MKLDKWRIKDEVAGLKNYSFFEVPEEETG